MCFSKKIRISNFPTKSADLHNIMSSNGIGKVLFEELNCHYVDLDNAYTCSDFNDKKNFKVIHLNVHSITAKHSQLIKMLNNLTLKGVNVHILLLCETLMNRQNKRGVRVAVYIITDLQHTLRQDLTIYHNDIFESCFVELKKNKIPSIVGKINHAPTQMNKDSYMNITIY